MNGKTKNLIENRFQIEEAKNIDKTSLFDAYKARDQQNNNYVFLKILKKEYSNDPEIVKNFIQYFENFQLKVKNTLNLVKVMHLSGSVGNKVYMVQEYIEGKTLDQFLSNNQKIQAKDFIPFFDQICEGLHYLHLRKLYHYKLAPQNILIKKDGKVKLVGFGSLFLILGKVDLLKKVIGGSKDLIAPEILDGKKSDLITGACDIYSLGKVIEGLDIPINNEILRKAIDREPAKRYTRIRDFKANASYLFFSDKAKGTSSEKDMSSKKTLMQKQIKLERQEAHINKFFRYIIPKDIISKTLQNAKCINMPRGANFKFRDDEMEFRWTPDKEDIGNHCIEFELYNTKEKLKVLLPIEVLRPGIRKPLDREGDQKNKKPMQLPDWKVKTSIDCNAKSTARFNLKNPNSDRYRVQLISSPPEAKNARFDEKSGDFYWKINKKDVGCHIFIFELIDLEDPDISVRKQIKIHVGDGSLQGSQRKKPAPPIDSRALNMPVWKQLIKLFMWPYNLILFISSAFGIIYILPSDLFIGLNVMFILEGLYLLIAINSNTLKKNILGKD